MSVQDLTVFNFPSAHPLNKIIKYFVSKMINLLLSLYYIFYSYYIQVPINIFKTIS